MGGQVGSQHTDVPLPPSPSSLATHTPAAQNQAVQNWAGGGAGCGSDTLSGWEGALAADLWKGVWGPGHLASQRGRKPREANGAERLEHSSPRPSLQSCPETQLPLQSLRLQSPPAITAVGWDREEDMAPNIPSWPPYGWHSRGEVSRDMWAAWNCPFYPKLIKPCDAPSTILCVCYLIHPYNSPGSSYYHY